MADLSQIIVERLKFPSGTATAQVGSAVPCTSVATAASPLSTTILTPPFRNCNLDQMIAALHRTKLAVDDDNADALGTAVASRREHRADWASKWRMLKITFAASAVCASLAHWFPV